MFDISTRKSLGSTVIISSPTIFPGRASGPKNSELDESASERFTNNDVLPSSPTIGLDSVTWKAAAVLSAVTLARPLANANLDSVPGMNPDNRNRELTIHPVWLIRVPRE
jgi:hypothetical protein